jgi:hypothetical protein
MLMRFCFSAATAPLRSRAGRVNARRVEAGRITTHIVSSSPNDIGGLAQALRTVAVLALLGGSALPGAARAAGSNDDEPPINGGNLLQTEVVEGRAWRLRGQVSTLYDSNITRSVDGAGAVRLSPLLAFSAGLPAGRQQLFFGAEYGRDIVFTQDRLNRGRNGVGGGVAWRLGTACSGIVGAERFQRLSLVAEQDELVNNVQTGVAVAGSIGCRTATGIGFGGSVEHQTASNDLPIRQPYDLRSTVYSPNISYGTPTIGQFSLSATFNSTQYPNRTTTTVDGRVEDGIRIFSGRFGYQRKFGSRLQLSLGASYLKTKPKPDTELALVNNQIVSVPRGGFSGSGYDVSLDYTPSTRLAVSLLASRNVQVSPNVGALFIIRSDFGADASYRLNPSMSLGLGGRLTKSKYEQSFTSPGENARLSDNTKRFYINFDYSPVKLYTVRLDLVHQLRRSDPVTFNYDSTSVRLNLIVNLGRG